MRTVSSGMQTHLESEEQTVALCWRIQRRDGTNYYFTDHDEIIPLSGHSYTPIDAGSPSNYRQGSNLNPSNMDLGMAFSSTSGRAAELRAGLFDYAEVWTFRVNWSSPSTVNMVKLAYGRLGEVEIRDNEARIEMRSLTQLLAVPIGNIYTPECRTDLGSSLCKVATSSTTYTRAGTISAVTSNKVFTVAGSASGQAADFYNYGTVRFNAGANNGVLLQVV